MLDAVLLCGKEMKLKVVFAVGAETIHAALGDRLKARLRPYYLYLPQPSDFVRHMEWLLNAVPMRLDGQTVYWMADGCKLVGYVLAPMDAEVAMPATHCKESDQEQLAVLGELYYSKCDRARDGRPPWDEVLAELYALFPKFDGIDF